ncbi:MAG: MbnP family protein [Bacteroidota bacterium]
MKKLVSLFSVLIVLVFISFSCTKYKGNGTLILSMHPTINGSDIDIANTIYTDPTQGVRFRMDHLEFYISSIKLTKKDNSVVSLSGADAVRLFYWKDIYAKTANYSIPAGEYTQITYTIGLDNTLNSTVPDDYNTNHPMGTNSGNYWIMNNSYIFSKLEGFVDTSNTPGAPLTYSYVYHIGDNGYIKEVSFNKSFTLKEKETVEIPFNIDVLKFWNGPSPINFKTELETHTTNKPDIANKLLNNYAAAITLE